MLLIGLTGGIASGKTLVSDRFAELDVPVVDADVIAREVVRPGSNGLQAIVEVFGNDILDDSGALDRAALRQYIFGNELARQQLNALLHPRIRKRSQHKLEALASKGTPYTIYAVPLLVETEQQDRFDKILLVDVPEAVQIARLIARDGSDEEAAKRILTSQATREQRLAVADDVIVNTGTIEDTLLQVDKLHRKYLKLAADLTGQV